MNLITTVVMTMEIKIYDNGETEGMGGEKKKEGGRGGTRALSGCENV